MTNEPSDTTAQRDRSPAYPNIPLKTALERLADFDNHFKRSPARPEKIGDAWGIRGKAYVDRTTAALRYFGLLEYQGSGKDRQITLSGEGRKYLRSQQEGAKREVIKAAALRPKQIAKFWELWERDRPADAACFDDLVFKYGFSEKGARDFLRIYDDTISFAKLSDSDKKALPVEGFVEDESEVDFENDPPPPPPPPLAKGKVAMMEGERVVFTEETTPQTYVKLVASGDVDENLLEALEDYVKRQKKRLGITDVGKPVNVTGLGAKFSDQEK
jgi:hypothetical protein